MAVIVNRFKVRRNGIVYGPGQPGGKIITGLSKAEEARLIAGSNGTIEKYIPFVVEKSAEKAVKEPAGNTEPENTEEPEETEENTEEDILNINIDDLIKSGDK